MERHINTGIPILLVLLSTVNTFNLDPRTAIIFTNPNIDERRQSYFGFSVALLKTDADDKAWLMVGAPRANSSMYDASKIKEPGAFYKCGTVSKTCQEVRIHPDGTIPGSDNQQNLKSNSWLGSALDSQPGGRHATAVCAGRFINRPDKDRLHSSGECYWLNSSLSDGGTEHEMEVLFDPSKQYFSVPDTNPVRHTYYYAHGQAGMAVHFPDHVNNTEILIGSPGVLNWQGTVIKYKDFESIDLVFVNRRRRQAAFSNSVKTTDEQNMFKTKMVPNPFRTPNIYITDFDYFGYAVSSGRLEKGTVSYVGGSPRGEKSRGKVIVFQYPESESESLIIKESISGMQLGEYFGGSVAMLDANGDGVDELVVGAPLHALPNKADVGKVYYYNNKNGKLVLSSTQFVGSGKGNSRFATTLSVIGDLNNDGYQDLAVGAPWEDDGMGAVYIYLGSETGLRAANTQREYSQRLSPDHFKISNLRGFGMAITRGVDVDGNHYPDLGIGSFASGHAVLLYSRPIVKLTPSLIATPDKISINATSLNLNACVDITATYQTTSVEVEISLSLDHGFSAPRASFSDGSTTTNFTMMVIPGVNSSQPKCNESIINILELGIDLYQPILMKMAYSLKDDFSTPDDLKNLPVLDSERTEATLEVGIVTGCEQDGNDTCHTDMRVDANFQGYREDSSYTVGTKTRIPLLIEVSNHGERAFLPILRVEVEDPLELYLPRSHGCEMPEEYDGTRIICKLNNPLETKDNLSVGVDVSKLTDEKSEVSVNVTVNSEGSEIQPGDNSKTVTLKLHGKSLLTLTGYSKEEQLIYNVDENRNINTTNDLEVLHIIQVLKKGSTPISDIEVNIQIPTNFSESYLNEKALQVNKTKNQMKNTLGISLNNNFLQMTIEKSQFGGQQVVCLLKNVVHARFDEDSTDHAINIEVTNDRNSSESEGRRTGRSMKNQRTAMSRKSNGDPQSKDSALSLNCVNGTISCAQVSCPIGPWLRNSDSVLIHLRFKLNLTVLAQHMPTVKGAELVSHAKAAIRNSIAGDSETEFEIRTPITPNIAEHQGIPLWYIILAGLAGVLLLGLISYGLYKSGFFKREKKEEMDAQREAEAERF